MCCGARGGPGGGPGDGGGGGGWCEGTGQYRKPLLPQTELDPGTPKMKSMSSLPAGAADDCESDPRSEDNHSNLMVIVMKLFICITYANQVNQSLFQLCAWG